MEHAAPLLKPTDFAANPHKENVSTQRNLRKLERFSMTFTANSKRQTSDSRLRFLKVNNKYTKIEKNNSGVYDSQETSYFHLEAANG